MEKSVTFGDPSLPLSEASRALSGQLRFEGRKIAEPLKAENPLVADENHVVRQRSSKKSLSFDKLKKTEEVRGMRVDV